MHRRLTAAVLLAVALPAPTALAGDAPAAPAPAPEPRMHVAVSLSAPRVADVDDLVVDVRLRNEGTAPARLHARLLEMPSVALEVVDADGARVPLGPPPVPPRDDGEAGRRTLAPGETLDLRFPGTTVFGASPEPGRYRLRYRFRARNVGPAHDWEGDLVSDWVDLRVG